MNTQLKNLRIFHLTHHTVWVIATVVNILALLWMLAAGYGGMVNPAKSTIGALLAMTIPGALIVNVLLLIANMFLFRRLAIVNAAALIACIGPIFTYTPMNMRLHKATRDDAECVFSLMTYNVYEFDYYGEERYDGEKPNRTISYILAKDPDILCMQECPELSPLRRWRYNGEQFDSLLRRYPYHQVNESGLALFSKYPAYQVNTNKNVLTTGFYADYECYRLSVEGHKLYIFNVHLESIGLTKEDKQLYRSLMSSSRFSEKEVEQVRRQLVSKLSHAFRQRAIQAAALRANIDSIVGAGNNVIVCGDFNDIPGCYATRTVRGSDMTDAFAHAGLGPSITYHANKFLFRIDHVFYRGDLRALDISRQRVNTSDHYPVFATFEWKN